MIKKSDIQAIYPLMPKQRDLAFYSLQDDIQDPGFIQLRFVIRGPLDQTAFSKAWQELSARHESLRMSLQSPKQKQSMIVVSKRCDLPVEWVDVRDKSAQDRSTYLSERLAEFRDQGLDLASPSVNRLLGVRTGDDEIEFFWACHHLLVDGWSAIIQLNDLAQIYSSERISTPITPAASSTGADYLAWLSSRSQEASDHYWSESLQGYTKPTLLSNCFRKVVTDSTVSKDENIMMEITAAPGLGDKVEFLASELKTTPAAIVYSAWGIYLAAVARSGDVVFGTTTAGRMFDLPDSQAMTGYFSNVIPRRMRIVKDKTFAELTVQSNQDAFASLEFEYVHLEQIQACSEIPLNQMLFDNLVLMENLPLDDIELQDPEGQITIGEFSGGQTTRYPLTLTIRPGSEWRFRYLFQPELDTSLLRDALNEFPNFLLKLATEASSPVDEHLQWISNRLVIEPLSAENSRITANEADVTGQSARAAQLARNKTELAVATIWEELLDLTGIDIHAEFIALGGRSILAVRMLAQIEDEFGVKLSMRDMVQEPTIAAIAKHIDGDAVKTPWTSLIPLKPAGSLQPVIFVNGGRGHALFMRSVTRYFEKDRPVIGMQLTGLDEDSKPMTTVHEMADHFLAEIISYQPQGPYYLVAHCFGVAVVHEMVRRLENQGETVAMVVVLDAIPPHVQRPASKYERTFNAVQQVQGKSISRYWSLAVRVIKNIEYLSGVALLELRRRYHLHFGSAFERSEARFDLAYKACHDAMEAYIGVPIKNKVVLISSLDNSNPMYEEWRQMTPELEIMKLPIMHNTMFTEPEVATLGVALSELVENAGTGVARKHPSQSDSR